MVLSSRSPRAFNSDRQYLLERLNFVRRNSLVTSVMESPTYLSSFDPMFSSNISVIDEASTNFGPLSGTKRSLSEYNGALDYSLSAFLMQGLPNPSPFAPLPEPVLIEDSASESVSDSSSEPTKKRRKTNTNDTKFRPYQAEKWREMYEELVEYRKQNGNAMVPHTYPTNPALARWVKRQRHQRVLQKRGDPRSSCTPDRIELLDNLGFVWDSHEVSWRQRVYELHAYKEENGHCLVPSTYPKNAQLATWVKCQRRQYKLFVENKTSNITQERIDQLNEIGFEWELRAPPQKSVANKGDESFLSFLGEDFLEVFSDISDSEDTEYGDEPLPADFGW